MNYHPWKPADGKRLRHWGVQPEVRYWFCERFNRTFMGLHGHYAEFNVEDGRTGRLSVKYAE